MTTITTHRFPNGCTRCREETWSWMSWRWTCRGTKSSSSQSHEEDDSSVTHHPVIMIMILRYCFYIYMLLFCLSTTTNDGVSVNNRSTNNTRFLKIAANKFSNHWQSPESCTRSQKRGHCTVLLWGTGLLCSRFSTRTIDWLS